MCLMLYIGTAAELPLRSTPDLRIEAVHEARKGVRQWFSHPEVRFIGAHTGCSCGFPSVIAETPVEYFEGMSLESDHRSADLRSVRALLDMLSHAGRSVPGIELYPIADGDESKPPKGVINWRLDALDPDRLFFNEGFMHRVHVADGPVGAGPAANRQR